MTEWNLTHSIDYLADVDDLLREFGCPTLWPSEVEPHRRPEFLRRQEALAEAQS
jgi:hypothetical protein